MNEKSSEKARKSGMVVFIAQGGCVGSVAPMGPAAGGERCKVPAAPAENLLSGVNKR